MDDANRKLRVEGLLLTTGTWIEIAAWQQDAAGYDAYCWVDKAKNFLGVRCLCEAPICATEVNLENFTALRVQVIGEEL